MRGTIPLIVMSPVMIEPAIAVSVCQASPGRISLSGLISCGKNHDKRKVMVCYARIEQFLSGYAEFFA
jgi:hypothetical protein